MTCTLHYLQLLDQETLMLLVMCQPSWSLAFVETGMGMNARHRQQFAALFRVVLCMLSSRAKHHSRNANRGYISCILYVLVGGGRVVLVVL